MKIALLVSLVASAAFAGLPHLEKTDEGTRLIVQGKPFIVIGGEAHNSGASTPDAFSRVCAKFAHLNANTIIAPIAWEQFEPEEGKFDYTLIDSMIRTCRKTGTAKAALSSSSFSKQSSGLKLVILWFGAWKNGVSSYVPDWVKRDTTRFPRVQFPDGPRNILSPFDDRNRNADAKAFAALMRRIHDRDEDGETVIAVQIENEMGIHEKFRDYSEAITARYRKEVSHELMSWIAAHKASLRPELLKRWESSGCKTEGTWEDVFGIGPETEAIFTVWHYARYTEALAATGKREHDIPMYANAWLPDPNGKPGNFPCGGPVPAMLDVWRAAAPSVDFLSPDIYRKDFKQLTDDYTGNGNPLFIPENNRRDADLPGKAYWALGRHQGIGFSPFAFEDIAMEGGIAGAYALLNGIMPLMAAAQGTKRLSGAFHQEDETNAIDKVEMDGWTLNVEPRASKGPNGNGGCVIIQLDSDTFLVAGHEFELWPEGGKFLTIESGFINKDGAFEPTLRLNGDETRHMDRVKQPAFNGGFWNAPDVPTLFRFKLFKPAAK